MTPFTTRLASGGSIDRSKPLSFQFDGRSMTGFEGDSIASALMANGVNVIARSFKYHRPRGFFGRGSEEPNAIVTIGRGANAEPNLVATQISLRDGMEIRSQNRWPSLQWDVGALNGWIAPLLPSGFYYKTFMWPGWAWKHYEHVIRHAAGFGVVSDRPDPQTYVKRYCHCDVLVVGAGPAGLKAALDAAATGARLIVCDEGEKLGGSLLDHVHDSDKRTGYAEAEELAAKLQDMAAVTVLSSTTVFGWYDHNYLLAVTRHDSGTKDRQTLYKIRAAKVILATGAMERSMLFEGNDRPGVMLCSAVQRYINRYGVKPGQRAVIYTNNDSGYGVLEALNNAGVTVVAVFDRRETCSPDAKAIADRYGIDIQSVGRLAKVHGGSRVRAVTVHGKASKVACDLVCVSGGWTPTTHLLSQRGEKLRFDDTRQTLVPVETRSTDFELIGAAAGDLAFQGEVLTDWKDVSEENRRSKIFVDLQNDVLAADLTLAVREGYGDVELAKRYTTTGMGTDQGKTSNVHAIGLLAELTGKPANDVGYTTFRAPYTPVTFGAVVGQDVGSNMAPVRRTPFHIRHAETGAVFEPSSSWLYPKFYARDGVSMDDAIIREVTNTRANVGMVDMSSLGKIELCGPDAVKFLELAYVNKFAKLDVGRCRYGILLRHDGMVLDDGTVTRIAEDRYLITMTTAQSWLSQLHLERLLQVDYPDLNVVMLPVTEQWASLAVAGPKARAVLQKLAPDFDVSNEAFPFTHYREGTLAGLSVRVFRVSFSGELSYEINVGANHACALWDAVVEAGREFGIGPYGLEALDIMRIEKGHLNVGTEIDGLTSPDDLGLGRMVKTDGFFVGKPLLNRKDFQRDDRLQLVGLRPLDGETMIPRGGVIVEPDERASAKDVLGHVTATVMSPTLDSPIALALIRGGQQHEAREHVIVESSVASQSVMADVCSPVFVDPAGEKLRV